MDTLRNVARGPQQGPSPENWSRIPIELRQRPQWCLAGRDKAPRTITGGYASSTDPATWTDFDSACRSAAERGWDIGFIATSDDPFTCIDLDVKDHTPVEHIERFNSMVEQFDSYTERSRSGDGLHIWLEGNIGRGRRSRDGVEVYSQERFLICTGNVVRDRPIENRADLLANLVSRMGPALPAELKIWGDAEPDWVLATNASLDNGELGRLFAGDWQGRYPSQSEADLALVKLLMPHSDSPRACWSTFQLSKLGERKKAKRSDYARFTLARAAQHLANDAEQIENGRAIAANLLWHPPSHNSRHFRLLSDEDLRAQPPQRWLVKGIIPEAGIGTLFGQSGTFKSFLALDLMAHISNGHYWFGRRVNAAPAVYVPFEGQGGIPKRVAAWRLARQHNGCEDAATNMRFITEPMNLRLPAHRDKLVATVADNGWAGGVLGIDTLAQAGPGIDENTSQGMGEMIAIFQELQQRLGGVVLAVHHSGKSEKAGIVVAP